MFKRNKTILIRFTEDKTTISQLTWMYDLSPYRILEILSYELNYEQIINYDKGNEELRVSKITNKKIKSICSSESKL